jgi:glycosyltransferase involved in cell wall biosynthesis
MTENPLISVCVPSYNYGRFLRDCLESVQAQTFKDWELIVCDDCSTDDTEEIVQGYAAADSRIRYFKNEQRLGMNANIKKVADLGRGQYLKILCSDDWLAPNCLEVFRTLMDQNQSAALATSAEVLSSEAGKPLQVQFLFGHSVLLIPGEKMLDRMARGEGFGGNSSFFIRASAYRQVGGYDQRCLYAADYDLAARLCRVGNYLHTDEPLFYGRVQPESSSSQDPKKLVDVIDFFELPERIFQPRRFGNAEWRRYQRLTASLTARYLLNCLLQDLRGDHSYARNLRRLLWKHGNFAFGIPWLAGHIPMRLYRLISGRRFPDSLKPPRNAGTPSAIRRYKSQAEI